MTTLLLSHPACLEHDPGPGHPESRARLAAVLAAMEAAEFAGLRREEAPEATRAELALVHPAPYIDQTLDAIPRSGYRRLDADTVVSAGSGAAALRAAGAVVEGVRQVMDGRAHNAFCAVRPPGHHARPLQAMGFCLFGNIAIGALYARTQLRLARVAAVDFDVHHGNGTQEVFERDPALFYASSHQAPFYPGTGAAEERGVAGNVVNVPLRAGTGSDGFRRAWGERILPALADFRPELVLISAGFDAHADDPLAGLALQTEDYAWVTRAIMAVADSVCSGRIVSALEGGYNLDALAASVAAHVRTLMAG